MKKFKKRKNLKHNLKILLIVPRYEFTNKVNYKYTFPLGLAYISSTLKQTGYQTTCLNLNHHNGTIKDLIDKALSEQKYDVVCTGHMALWYPIVKSILNAVREHGSCPKIILGGSIITSEPELMFRSLNPDFVVVGEGEKTILELMEHLEKNLEKKGKIRNIKDFEKIKGIGYHDKDGKIIFTEKREPIENLDSLPYPDFDGFGFKEQLNHMHTDDSDNNNMLDYPRTYPILASRGCPFQCTFCYHSLGRGYRMRSIDSVMKELKAAIKKYQINNIVLYDDCFSANENRLYEFCKQIKKLNCRWNCQLTVNTADKKMLKALKDSGCDLISFGFESFSPAILKSMRKPITPEQIDQVLNDVRGVNIGIQANFIFGDVAETTKTAYETLNYWKKNGMGRIRLDFIQPYPGSVIYQHCLKKGIIKDKIDFIENHMRDFYGNMTNSMTNKEFEKLKKDVFLTSAKYDKFVTAISIKNTDKASKDNYTIRVRCPHCKKIIKYKNIAINNKYIRFYRIPILCRNCHMRFNIVSSLRKLTSNYHLLKIKPVFNYLKKAYVSARKNKYKK